MILKEFLKECMKKHLFESFNKYLEFEIPINTMVRFLKLVAFLDHFRAILGTLLKKCTQNGPKMVQKRY
jgi:hypothetical protein